MRHAFPLVRCDLVLAACACSFVVVGSVEVSLVLMGVAVVVGAVASSAFLVRGVLVVMVPGVVFLVFVGSSLAVGAVASLACPARAVLVTLEAVGSVAAFPGLVVASVVDVVASLASLVRAVLVVLAAADLAVAFLVGVVPAVAVVLVLVGVAVQILAGPGSCV